MKLANFNKIIRKKTEKKAESMRNDRSILRARSRLSEKYARCSPNFAFVSGGPSGKISSQSRKIDDCVIRILRIRESSRRTPILARLFVSVFVW